MSNGLGEMKMALFLEIDVDAETQYFFKIIDPKESRFVSMDRRGRDVDAAGR